MPDVFANITKVPDEMVAMVADVLETRAAIPSQQEMVKRGYDVDKLKAMSFFDTFGKRPEDLR